MFCIRKVENEDLIYLKGMKILMKISFKISEINWPRARTDFR